MTTALPQLVITKLQAFVGWMAEFYINNNGDITDSSLLLLTKVDFKHFNHFKINSMLLPSPITPGPTRSPVMVISGMSDSQITSLTSRREPREIYLYIQHSTVRSTMTPSISHSMLPQGHKALGTFLTQISSQAQ